MLHRNSNGRRNKHIHSAAWRKTFIVIGFKKLLQDFPWREGTVEGKNRLTRKIMANQLNMKYFIQ